MPTREKVISFRVSEADWKAFEAFIQRNNLKPYGVLRMLVETYAAGEHLRHLIEENKVDKLEAVAELGRIAERLRSYLQLNGAVAKGLRAIGNYYHIDLGV